MTAKKSLLSQMDDAFSSLLTEAFGGNLGAEETEAAAPNTALEFSDKVKLLDAAARFAALKHKIAPEEEASAFDELKSKLAGGKASRR